MIRLRKDVAPSETPPRFFCARWIAGRVVGFAIAFGWDGVKRRPECWYGDSRGTHVIIPWLALQRELCPDSDQQALIAYLGPLTLSVRWTGCPEIQVDGPTGAAEVVPDWEAGECREVARRLNNKLKSFQWFAGVGLDTTPALTIYVSDASHVLTAFESAAAFEGIALNVRVAAPDPDPLLP